MCLLNRNVKVVFFETNVMSVVREKVQETGKKAEKTETGSWQV